MFSVEQGLITRGYILKQALLLLEAMNCSLGDGEILYSIWFALT